MTLSVERILDLCVDALRAGKDPEGILREHPESASELRPLLSLAQDLQSLPSATPSDAGMAALVAKLAAAQAQARPRLRWFSGAVMLRAAALLLVTLALGWGATAASSSTLPGDFLYPLKLFTERVKFFLAVTDAHEVELRITFSEERLREFVRVHGRGKEIDKTVLNAMLDEAKSALEHASSMTGDERSVVASRVASMTERQRLALEKMIDKATENERAELAPYVERCTRQCAAACQLLGVAHGAVCPICNRPMQDEAMPHR